MLRLSSLAIVIAVLHTSSAIVCWNCRYTYSAPDGIQDGPPACADAAWGSLPANETYIGIDCMQCYKELYDLGADRFEVVRDCTPWGLVPPENGVTAWDRQQKSDTCVSTQLRSGVVSRCVCDTDMCNAGTQCDDAVGCFNDVCATTCPPSTCPPTNAPGSASTTISGLVTFITTVFTAVFFH